MPTLDQLSGEKRAILELVLRRGQSYDDIAAALDMPVERVREHARDSLAALAPLTARRVDSQWRGQVADYLLGQQSGPEVKATRAHLKASEPARAWALSTLDSLGDLYAHGREPFIPAGGRARPERPGRRRLRRAEPAAGAVTGPAATPERDGATEELERPEPTAGAGAGAGERIREEEVDAHGPPAATREAPPAPAARPRADDRRTSAADEWRRFKRRGRVAVIVGALALLAIALVVILLALGGDEEPASDTVATPTTETDADTETSAATTPTAAEVALEPVGNVDGNGVARIISQGEQAAVSLRAQLPSTQGGEAYVVWLANSPEDSVPVAAQETDPRGNFGGNAQLPPDHEDYRYLDILAQDVRERTEYSGQPILRGDLDAAEEIELQDGGSLPQAGQAERPGGGGKAGAGRGARSGGGAGDNR